MRGNLQLWRCLVFPRTKLQLIAQLNAQKHTLLHRKKIECFQWLIPSMKWLVIFAAPVQPWQKFKWLGVIGQDRRREEVMLLSQVELQLHSARRLVAGTARTCRLWQGIRFIRKILQWQARSQIPCAALCCSLSSHSSLRCCGPSNHLASTCVQHGFL